MKFFLVILLGLNILGAVEVVSKTVVDNTTKLEWQDYYAGSSNEKHTSWEDALTYCEELVLEAKGDWRLPSIKELYTISDRQNIRKMNHGFIIISDSWVWSSTSVENNKGRVWVVDFDSSSIVKQDKGKENDIRCVRDK